MVTSGHLLRIMVGAIILSTVNTAKILFIAHLFARSHFNVFEPIIDGLARHNHDITIHSYFNIKTTYPNVKFLQLTVPDQTDHIVQLDLEEEAKKDPIGQFRGYVSMILPTCTNLLSHNTTKDLLKNERQFDVVVVDALFHECATALASVLGKHTVFLFTSAMFSWTPTSVPMPPSYVPNMIAPLTTKMSFFQRMRNMYYFFAMQYISQHEMLEISQNIATQLLPQAPQIHEAVKQVAFYLTNADPVMFAPRPSMPHVADCGGMHCTKTQELPKDLKDFVEGSGDEGFIIFGLGSGVNAAMLKPDFIQAFVSAFGKLKQKVVWKFDKPLENLPSNIKTVSWMPQQDLLGHPKARLFITHAGLLSLQEAIYHGVPVLPIPLFAEQPGNAARVVELGIGETVNFLNVTADGIYGLITKILNDKSYYENMKRYSSIFKDQPERPVERALFWIEYVIRHDGARHLKSAAEDLNFFQYFLLDVIALLIVTMVAGLGITRYLCKLCLCKMLSAKKHSRKESAKKKN